MSSDCWELWVTRRSSALLTIVWTVSLFSFVLWFC
jgi:hypothetical protein